jgi:TonB-linked SusC/RagA family outer membrane protein
MKKLLSIIIFLLICVSTADAQQNTIVRGLVTDKGGPLPGAVIIEKDVPNNGVSTTIDGKFTLTLKGRSHVIIVRSVGYISQEIKVTGAAVQNIKMQEDVKGLEEVIIVGYGTQKKITNTGAVSSITGDEIRQSPSASIQNTLMGRLPGVVTQQQSGRPGQDGALIRIRGLSTFVGDGDASSGIPLVVVDDIEFRGSLSDIDPDQVESLTILKDAATTAVYGVKGANGVIVITTRRGKAGRPAVTVKTETALQSPVIKPKYLGAYQTVLLRNQAVLNDNPAATPIWSAADVEAFRTGSDPYGHPDVNWYNELIRPSSLQSRTNMNISGGADKVKYFISGGYLWQNGIIKDFSSSTSEVNSNYYYKRYNFRSNLDIQATKTLSISLDATGTFGEENQPNIVGRSGYNNIFYELADYQALPPYAYAIYNPNGSYGAPLPKSQLSSQGTNIVGRLALGGYQRSFSNELSINLRGKQVLDVITKGLSVRGTIAYNNINSFTRNLTRTDFPSYQYDAATDTYRSLTPGLYRLPKLTLAYSNAGMIKRINLQGSVNYDRTFNTHHVYALALYNQYTNSQGAGTPENFRGFTGRVGYDYKQKYLLELNAAYNGTDRFQASKRYGFFPAASVGYNLAEEPFFKNAFKFINVFKLRGSYGLVGSDKVGSAFAYIYKQIYTTNGTYSLGEISRNVTNIAEGQLPNEDVRWEKEKSTDVGLDATLFGGRINLTADYFYKYRYDILTTREGVSTVIGAALPPVNLGIVDNRGYEVSLTYKGNVKGFSYSVNGNISVAKNKIIFRDEAAPAYPWLAKTGGPIGRVNGYIFDGFYTDATDIANSAQPVTGGIKPGDIKYKDLNNDGVIDANDTRVLDYPNIPNTVYGFNTSLGYKNFSLSVTLQAATNFTFNSGGDFASRGGNYREINLDTWSPTNLNPALPRLSDISTNNDPNVSFSNFWSKRFDYLRLKNIELSYRLKTKWLDRAGISNIRFYANGYNLLTWMLKDKNIYDIDPETASTAGTSGYYPQQKIYNFGLQLSF